jgi:hypothetical protein
VLLGHQLGTNLRRRYDVWHGDAVPLMSVPQTAAILVGLVALGGCGRGNAVISPAVVLEGDLD